MRIHEELPPAGEVNAYIKQLQWLLDNGAQIKLLQLYTVARQPARDYVDKLTEAELEKIAAEARKLSIPVENLYLSRGTQAPDMWQAVLPLGRTNHFRNVFTASSTLEKIRKN